MKNLLIILLFFPIIGFSQSDSKTYVRTYTYTDITSVSDPSKANPTVVYYDGIGRPIQRVDGIASPLKKDIITYVEYDGFGKEVKKYLPFESSDSGQLYDTQAKTHTEQFYLTDKYENTSNPYSEQFFEGSPVNRTIEQAAPGGPWKGASQSDYDHTIKYEYKFNSTLEVRRFSVSFKDGDTEMPELITQGYYSANQLYKSIVKDENWSPDEGKNRTIEEFKDKEGRIVLRRGYNKMPTDAAPDTFADIPHDTYYIYDSFSNLSYVIPPLAADKIVFEARTSYNATVNYPFTKLLLVKSDAEELFNNLTISVKNNEILNVDYYDRFSAKGGFSIQTDEAGKVILNINFATETAQPFKTGVIADLSDKGNFEDKALGRIEGDDYSYIFYLRDNKIEVFGYGNVPSKIVSFSNQGANFQYGHNYPWTNICVVDSDTASKYDSDIANLPNSQILTTFTPNRYNAQGGLSAAVGEDDTVSISINITSDSAVELKTGSVFTILTDRALEDRDLGTVTGPKYSYTFSVRNNMLFIEGAGFINHLSFFANVGRAFRYTINHDVERLCYIYKYDKRNRPVEKYIPDNGWSYMIYDKLDRPIMTQDENLRVKHSGEQNWMFIKYDNLGRLAFSGLCWREGTRQQIQSFFNDVSINNNEEKVSSGFVQSGRRIFYSNTISTGDNVQVLAVNYYDDYNFEIPFQDVTSLTIPATNSYNEAYATNVKGLPTGSMIAVLDNDSDPSNNRWIINFTKYDHKSRPIWAWSHNSYLAAWQGVESKLDFTGNVLEMKTSHAGNGFTMFLYDYFTYDQVHRLLRHSQRIGDNGPLNIIAWNHYDELGSVSEKMVGGILASPQTDYSAYANSWQTINYSNNIRGWLKGINSAANDPSASSDLFRFWINYDNLYNGNISGTTWKLSSNNILKYYDYEYDGLNRLTNATYRGNLNTGENYSEGPISYDKNGNIKSLERWGYVGPAFYEKMDILIYQYKPLSNQLLAVSDNGSGRGFTDSNYSGYDYDYDSNGNLKYDLNKGFGSQSTDDWTNYNHLNLPTLVKKNESQWIEYIYDATGTKIQKMVHDGENTDATSYVFGFVYLNDKLQYFSHPEGYTEYDANEKFTYFYNYKDHLGNVRVTFTKNASGLQVQDSNDYYPFGLKHEGIGVVMPGSIANKIKYNGMELQDELGLNMYDYGARNYDPAIGRWFNVDPLAENSRRWSPYTYCYNNPMRFIDPDGMQAYPPDENELMDNWGISVNDIENGYNWTDSDGSWTFDKASGYWQGQNGTDVNIPAASTELDEVVITKEPTPVEKVSNFGSNTVAPFLETAQDIAFPIINQVNIVANEGPHEGGANNSDNILLPKTYEFKNWGFDSGKTITTGNLSLEEGKEKLMNTVSIMPVTKVAPFSSALLNWTATQGASAAIKTPLKQIIKHY